MEFYSTEKREVYTEKPCVYETHIEFETPEQQAEFEDFLQSFDLEEYKRHQWHRINTDDRDTFPPVDEDGESDYIEISYANWTVTAIGQYREDENGGAFYIGDYERSMESVGLIVNAWRYTGPYRENKKGDS